MPISKKTNLKTLGAQFWEKHVKSFKISQLSQGEYCRRNKLKLSAFGYWYRKLNYQTSGKKIKKNKNDYKGGFIEISDMVKNKNQSTILASALLEIEFGNGWKIKIPAGWEPESLKLLLSFIKEEVCL